MTKYIVLIAALIIVLLYAHYRPFIDRTSDGDIVIWYNWKSKRIYKYLWKRNT
jgi:hypothetical protein